MRKRSKYDYYFTPIDHIELFLNHFIKCEPGVFDDACVLDPCAGGDKKYSLMPYPYVIQENFPVKFIHTIDIREDSLAEEKADYIGKDINFSYDIIISNPPFCTYNKKGQEITALDFILKALKDVRQDGWVIMLQRVNFLGSQKRFSFWGKYVPKYIFVHHRRMSFTGDGGTDNQEYAHYVWKKGVYPEFTKLKVI